MTVPGKFSWIDLTERSERVMAVMIYGLLFGFLLGLIRGGRLAALRLVSLRLSWLVVPVVPLQLIIMSDPWHLFIDINAAGAAMTLTYVPLIIFVGANIRAPGAALVGLGLAANLAVMLANGGLMPVSPEAIRDTGLVDESQIQLGGRTPRGKAIVLPAPETRLGILADIIPTPPIVTPTSRVPHRVMMSIGDIIVFLGVVYGVQAAMRRSAGSTALESSQAPVRGQ